MSAGTEKPALGPRQYALAAGLAVAVAATLWAAQMEEQESEAPVAVAPTRPAPRPATPAVSTTAPAPAPAPAWTLAERAPWPEASGSQLAAWSPPPPPPPPPAAPLQAAVVDTGPPPAPPFPYQLIGRLEEGGVPAQALLASGNRSLSAKAGDVIDGQWRVDSVGPSGLALTWLPGQQTQTLTFRPS
ncbi:UNVERIFIED_ORG: hypothetical protein LHJ69_02560 [Shinella sp. XGS7]|nr:hypothetical protein [Shinella sp. XGS7]